VFPFATFLAGSLLTMLLPVCLLIALAIWYTLALRRVPDPPEPPEAGSGPAEAVRESAPQD
jgi:hypothetical protein